MRRDELKRLLRGVIVATPTPFDDAFEVDYGRMAEMTEWWVENGLVEGKAAIKCISLMGEGPQLADEEWPHLVRTVVHAADGRVRRWWSKRGTSCAKRASAGQAETPTWSSGSGGSIRIRSCTSSRSRM